jgi:hypothetical protein
MILDAFDRSFVIEGGTARKKFRIETRWMRHKEVIEEICK